MDKNFTIVRENYLPIATGFSYTPVTKKRYSRSENFAGVYPDEFKDLDDLKETSYVNFELSTLTIVENDNGQKIFYPKVVNGNRKYPYYVGIQDNNGSCLPPEFNPNDIKLYEMFGVHFYEKPLTIDIKESLSGCKKYIFYEYCGIANDDSSLPISDMGKTLCFTTRGINKLKMPGFIVVNVLNGVNEPKVYINDIRQYTYIDKKMFDDTNKNNLDDYKNILFERRVFTPEPYKKVYKLNNSDTFYYIKFRTNIFKNIEEDFRLPYSEDETEKKIYDGYEEITDLTLDEFKGGKFYIKINETIYQIAKQYYPDTIYYVKIQLYVKDTIYGIYRPSEVHDVNYDGRESNKILIYRKNNLLLWKEPEIRYGITVSNDYVDSEDEVVDNIPYDEVEKYTCTDNGGFQYIQLNSDETTITVDDGYTQENFTHSDTDTIGINGNLYFGSNYDSMTFNLGLEYEIDETNTLNVDDLNVTSYLFYYLEDENKKNFKDIKQYSDKKFNENNYPVLTFQKFCTDEKNIPPMYKLAQEVQDASLMEEYPIQDKNLIPEGKHSNYPYDWVEKNNFGTGYKFNLEDMPSIFKKATNLKTYPGYIGKINVNSNELRFKLNSTKLGSMLFGGRVIANGVNHPVDGMYEDNADNHMNNFRFFSVTDVNNKRIISPLYDQRTIHVSYLHYLCYDNWEEHGNNQYENFSNYNNDITWYEDGQYGVNYNGENHTGQFTKSCIYVWPQRPSRGRGYENNTIYDILEMPNITNYEFSLSTIFPKRKKITYTENGTEHEVEMNEQTAPDASYNEYWEYDTNATIKLDLTALDENSYETKGYGISYLEFRDYKDALTFSLKDLEKEGLSKPTADRNYYVTFYREPSVRAGWPDKIIYYNEVTVDETTFSEYYVIDNGEFVHTETYDEEATYYNVHNGNAIINTLYPAYPLAEGTGSFADEIIKNMNLGVLNAIRSRYKRRAIFTDQNNKKTFTCKARALKINTELFGDNLILDKWTNFLFKDATNISKYAMTSIFMAVKEMTYNDFLYKNSE